MSVLKKAESGKKIYATIYDGKFVVRVKEGTEGSEPRELTKGPNAGKVIHEIKMEEATGIVKSTNIKNGDYGDQLEIEMVSNITDEVSTVLQVPAEGGYGSSLMKRWGNVDFSIPLTVRPYSFETEEGKIRSGINLFQDGVKYDPLYTKENPNGMPEPEKKKKGKGFKWDWTDQENFLMAKFESHKPDINTLPSDLAAAASGMGPVEEAPATVEETDDGFKSDEENDLPF